MAALHAVCLSAKVYNKHRICAGKQRGRMKIGVGAEKGERMFYKCREAWESGMPTHT